MKNPVLLVDDSPSLHKLVRAYLESEPLVVHSVYDGEAALAAAVEIRPSLILMDVDMPHLNGFEVCRRLKANPSTTMTPVIFLTADMSMTDKVKGLDLGAADYITKPFKPDELKARVRSALRAKHRLDKTAMVDGLTGVWNRAYLDHHLPAHLSLARRSDLPLACLTADVDHLGRINEQHGRAVGDDVLRTVAHILLSQCRAEDTVCHFGGGKFIALLPRTARAGAAQLGDRARAEVERQLLRRSHADLAATCSFGASDSQPDCDVSLLDRADAALYRAKQAGRNGVCVSRPAAELCGVG